MESIIKNGTIIFKNGLKKSFEVISLTKTGVFTGYFQQSNKNHKEFIDQGFIPKDQIEKIFVFNSHSRLEEIDFKKM